MSELILLLKKTSDINLNVDSFLVAVDSLSCRSNQEFSIEDIRSLAKTTNKKIYLLCDRLVMEDEMLYLESKFELISKIGDLIFFSDVCYYMLAKKYNCLEKMVYYSPTLILNKEEILAWKELGVNKIIISKECEYQGYLDIASQLDGVDLGMLCFGYPQIYYSKRKMLTSYKEEYDLDISCQKQGFSIVEKSRDKHLPIIEDDNGTYIFASEVFFPGNHLYELRNAGITYFIIDSHLITDYEEKIPLVNKALNNECFDSEMESTFMMFRKMVDNYGKN